MSRQALHPSPDAGPAVRYLRNRKGWSQRELADAAGVTGAWLSQVEGGKRRPSWALVRRFGDAARSVRRRVRRLLVADRPWTREALPVSDGAEWDVSAVAGASPGAAVAAAAAVAGAAPGAVAMSRTRAAATPISTDLARELGDLCAHYVVCSPSDRQRLLSEARRLATGR